ncbi:MAG: amidohydrolase family protein [Planctomycetes bacterium]|nr:amidohydrolase family protein [Planctomycetota bacterium]
MVDRVIDAHVHFRHREPVEHFNAILDLVNYAQANILTGWEPNSLDRKREQPARFYTFGMLPHDPTKLAAGDGAYRVGLLEDLVAKGYDGVKMMEGKPAWRQQFKTPAIDDDYFRPFWEKAVALDVPITMHMADPVDYWWESRPDSYCHLDPQEECFRQTEAVLTRHPNLRITFAHFLFMGPQLNRLGDLFARFPTMRVDMALADEYLYYCSDDPETTRAFFITWQDRILYGTDISDHNSLQLAHGKAEMIRLFLETDQTFTSLRDKASGNPPRPGSNGRTELHGLALPVEVLDKVLGRNFESFAGRMPAPLP